MSAGWRRELAAVVLTVFCGLRAGPAMAEMAVSPRAPLAPGLPAQAPIMRGMVPAQPPEGLVDTSVGAAPPQQTGGLIPIASDTALVRNIGNAELALSFLVPAGAWHTVRVSPLGVMDIQCAACNGAVTLAYHDGAEMQTVDVSLGREYLLGWDAAASRWRLTER